MRSPAVSEILSAVAIIGVGAIVAALLFVIFNDRSEDSVDNVERRMDLSRQRASELLAPSNISCNGTTISFFLHNYGRDDQSDVMIANMTAYNIGDLDEDITPIWRNLDGEIANDTNNSDGNTDDDNLTLPGFKHGTTIKGNVTGDIDCNEGIVLITSAKEFIVVAP